MLFGRAYSQAGQLGLGHVYVTSKSSGCRHCFDFIRVSSTGYSCECAPLQSNSVAEDNFEIVQAAGSQYVALWGCESFTYVTKVARPSGHIISATEDDTLHLDGRLCPSLALTKCTAIPGVNEERLVSITG